MRKSVGEVLIVLLLLVIAGVLGFMVYQQNGSLAKENAKLREENHILKSQPNQAAMGEELVQGCVSASDTLQKAIMEKLNQKASCEEQVTALKTQTTEEHKFASDRIIELQAKLNEMGEKCILRPMVKSTKTAKPQSPPAAKKEEKPVVIINHNHIYVDKLDKVPAAPAPAPKPSPAPKMEAPHQVLVVPVAPTPKPAEKPKYKPNDLLK